MGETELGGVQGQAGRAALVRLRLLAEFAVVDLLTADRMAQLAQVDANLMGAARLEPARQQRVVLQVFDGIDMRDRLLAGAAQGSAAAPAVAAIADELAGDA